MKELFSLVIPTMWRSPLILEMLPLYQACSMVAEVIIIDNDPGARPPFNFKKLSKVSVHTRGHNIFVNPAWNWGASLAKHTITLVNDDINITDIGWLLSLISMTNYDIVGARINDIGVADATNGVPIVDAPQRFPANSYGCFMVVRKYHYIPEQIQIHAGDNHLFYSVTRRGIMHTGEHIHSNPSVTIKSDPVFTQISFRDRRIYAAFRQPSRFNIIIRTSNRPNYFAQCIKSIRKYAPHAMLHITIDNEPDLLYVAENCKGLNWRFYLVNREVVQNFCSKVPITRRPFIYNHYINIVRPFLDGWCMILDDDDQLVNRPQYYNDKRAIMLHRVDVGNRIVLPDNLWEKTPVLNNISALGIIFHHSQMVDWNPQRGGDFDFISNLYSRFKPVWINKLVATSQTGGNFGKRNDIAPKGEVLRTEVIRQLTDQKSQVEIRNISVGEACL